MHSLGESFRPFNTDFSTTSSSETPDDLSPGPWIQDLSLSPSAESRIRYLLDSNLCEALNSRGSRPRVLMIVTGGTICMTRSEESSSGALRPCSLKDYLIEHHLIMDPSLPIITVSEWSELLDSSDMTLIHWRKIATEIQQKYDDFDGFVVLHGTDTLAYSAAALSFMLENLAKPVIVTGSMLPLRSFHTDARKNLSASLMIAGYTPWLCEVCVVFGSRLLRANRCKKVDCSRMEAFRSSNFPALGRIGVDISLDKQLALCSPPDAPGNNPKLQVFTNLCMNVVVVTVTPCFNVSMLAHFFSSAARPLGIVLQLFGSGTAPAKEKALRDVLRRGIEAGVEIVAVTQCVGGTCNLLIYENGVELHKLGVIEGKDMTVEAAFLKMAYLMGKGLSGERLRMQMESNLRGELTETRHTSAVVNGGTVGTKIL